MSEYKKDHILVCLNSSPSNKKVIMSGIKLAKKNKARLTALYVETAYTKKLDNESKKLLDYNIKLAKDAGADIIITYGNDIAYQISEFAKVTFVTTIILGHTIHKEKRLVKSKSIVDKIMSNISDVEIYIIPDNEKRNFKNYPKSDYKFNKKEFYFTLLVVLTSALIGIAIDILLKVNEANIVVFFVLGVLLISKYTKGKLYGIIGSILSVIIYTFLFTEPKYSFQIIKLENIITLIIMLVVAIITNTLTITIMSQKEKAITNAYRTSILFEMNQAISQSENLEGIIYSSQKHIYKLIQMPFNIFILNDNGLVTNTYLCKGKIQKIAIENINIKLKYINKVYKNKTDLKVNEAIYIPLFSQSGIIAVIYINYFEKLDSEQKSLLYPMINQMGYAIERFYLNESKNKAMILIENERFRLNMFRLLSHDLKTPLTSISGNAKSILSNTFDKNIVKDLVNDIYDESIWLTNMVENILFLSKLENDKVVLKKEPQLVEEIIEEALSHINLKNTKIKITINKIDDFLMVNVDAQLIIQVIINLINNAINHSKCGTNITISVIPQDKMVAFSIIDDGEGITDKNKQQIFNMYFSLDNNKDKKRRGLGLGLALCKMIINAHNGIIKVEDNYPKGTIFKFTIPKAEVNINEK